MPSYLHNHPPGSGDAPPRPHRHSQYSNAGVITAPNSSAQQSADSTQGSSNNGPVIPPPPTYQTTSFRCTRCQQELDTRADLDCHSIGCGVAALVTAFFTPYSLEQMTNYHSPSQPHDQSPHGVGSFQNQNNCRGA